MSFADRENSRTAGQRVELYLVAGPDPTAENLARSVNIIPATTEFGYGTTRVEVDGSPANYDVGHDATHFQESLRDLRAALPHATHVNLVVGWFGDDLRAGECRIRPKVMSRTATDSPYTWQVGPTRREIAQEVSEHEGAPAYGGSPADRSVYEAIVALKAAGFTVTLYPFIAMDIPEGNGKPDPYGGSEQAAYPWRGRITCYPLSADMTMGAGDQIAAFFGDCVPADFSWNASGLRVNYNGPNEWGLRRFVLHLATIADAAGADAVLIGSELVGITTLRVDAINFPAAGHLAALAADVRSIVGAQVEISYAADWSEYHSHRPGDGSGDVLFHLDALWADDQIDYVGIDYYPPLSDWRDGDLHLDRQAGYGSPYDREYLWSHIEGGENFDWYYSSPAHRDSQFRTPIADGNAAAEHWVFRNKDLRGWWANAHHNRPGGSRFSTSTAWVPESKRLVLTEFGIPSVNRGPNAPNRFIDAKSSESALPYYSNGNPDAAAQRAGIEALLSYWQREGGDMLALGDISLWAWDARPWPSFPGLKGDAYGDSANYAAGHWLNGRMFPGRDFIGGDIGPIAFTDHEQPIVRQGVTYEPVPVRRGTIERTGTLDNSQLVVRVARGTPLDDLFLAYPPSQMAHLTIREGHVGDDPNDPRDFKVTWAGTILSAEHPLNEISLNCEPTQASLRRTGLRRHYQLGCPHALYGPDCRASREAATTECTVASVSGQLVTLVWPGVPDTFGSHKYDGGLVTWTNDDGGTEVRSIVEMSTRLVLRVRGLLRDLGPGTTVRLALGCNRRMNDCRNIHDNIHNFGGQPFIPSQNPLSQKNNFF